MTLERIAWSGVVLTCLLAALLLVIDGFVGYAGVSVAVGASAAINLR
ncbi:MAG: hypothetical protein M0P31_12710 [Solirubrobacteraceae bacterium]|nr:hypothetical protein [Solirubrobacteraceae bacterium]